MNIVNTKGVIDNGIVSLPKTFTLMGQKQLRIDLKNGSTNPATIEGNFTVDQALMEWEIDAMRAGRIEGGVLYLRNYGMSGFTLEANTTLGVMKREGAYRPQKKK